MTFLQKIGDFGSSDKKFRVDVTKNKKCFSGKSRKLMRPQILKIQMQKIWHKSDVK